MKIICNTPGDGFVPAKSLCESGTEKELPAYYNDHITPLQGGYIGDAELVWQHCVHYDVDMKPVDKGWTVCDKEYAEYIKGLGWDVRQALIAPIPAPNSVSEGDDSETIICGKTCGCDKPCYPSAPPVKAVEEEKKDIWPILNQYGIYQGDRITENTSIAIALMLNKLIEAPQPIEETPAIDISLEKAATAFIEFNTDINPWMAFIAGANHLKQTHVPVSEVVAIIQNSIGSDGKIHWPDLLLTQIQSLNTTKSI